MFGDIVLKKIVIITDNKEKELFLLNNMVNEEVSDIIDIYCPANSDLKKETSEVLNSIIDKNPEASLYITDIEDISKWSGSVSFVGWENEANKNHNLSGFSYVITKIEELSIEDFDHIYRRIAGLPCDILLTERLYIRETTVADLDEMFKLYSDPLITKYMEDLFEENEEREYQQNYIKNVYGFYDIGIWSLFLIGEDKSEGPLVGRMGIEMTQDEGVAEIGFMLGTQYQGMGYAREAGMAILKYSAEFPGITNVRARVHRDNFSSNKLCNTLGMTQIETDDDMIIWDYKIEEE